jgi:uncharacterized OB-fold protein
MTSECEPIPVALPVGPQRSVEAGFWEGLKAGELRLQHCERCDLWIWPATWVCSSCFQFDPPWRRVEPAGRVYSWTTTRHLFPDAQEFTGRTPYTVLLVELPAAGGRRLLGILAGECDERPVAIGESVRAWIQPASPLTGGWPVLRWRRSERDGPS